MKNHDFIHVKSTVAGKYNNHKQDGPHLRFPIRTILTVDLQVTSIIPMNFKSIALLVQEKKFKTDFQNGHHGSHLVKDAYLHNLHKKISFAKFLLLGFLFKRRKKLTELCCVRFS